MIFRFSPHPATRRDRVLHRLFSLLPGAASWTILLGMIGLAVGKPRLAAALVIAFNLYWLLRLLFMTIFLVLSCLRLSLEQDTDWMERVRYDYGETFLDMNNAKQFVSRCGRVSIGETMGQVMYRCEIVARPCQGEMKETTGTTK